MVNKNDKVLKEFSDEHFLQYEMVIHKFTSNNILYLRKYNIEYDDLFQELCMIYMKAYQSFDESKNFQFITYLYKALEHKIWEIKKYKTLNRVKNAIDPTKCFSLDNVIKDNSEENEITFLDLCKDTSPLVLEELENRDKNLRTNIENQDIYNKCIEYINNTPKQKMDKEKKKEIFTLWWNGKGYSEIGRIYDTGRNNIFAMLKPFVKYAKELKEELKNKTER